ncbi:virulence factor TspB C-terminal domain-related protein, partial [Moraxella bovis]|uniref:virulence factor TspB C-terminal domain-related protein n=1 Tax=Moraxella bovis TaxID=476 RepID=UPI0009CCEB49
AKPVCDFIDWVKQEPPEIEKPEVGEIKEDDIDWRQYAERKWLNLGNAQCPQDVRIPVQWMNVKQDLVISYVPFCRFATMIKSAVILGAYISALMIISVGRQRE